MHRAPRVILTVCLGTVVFGGRYVLASEGSRIAQVTSSFALAAENSFAIHTPFIPVAGADLDDLTAKARVCLSMLNTFVRRLRKRPLTGDASPAAARDGAQIWPRNNSAKS
jgi:hypothetical protein